MHFPSLTGILFIVLIAIILFGPTKLPQLGRAVGTTLKEFKLASHGLLGEDNGAPAKASTPNQAEQELRMQIEKEIREQMEREAMEKQKAKTV